MSLVARVRAAIRMLRNFGTSFDEVQRILGPGVPGDVSRDKLAEPPTSIDETRKGLRVSEPREFFIEVKKAECPECAGTSWGVTCNDPDRDDERVGTHGYKVEASKQAHELARAYKADGITAVVRIEERNGATERRYEASDNEKQLPLAGETTDEDIEAAKTAAAADPLAS